MTEAWIQAIAIVGSNLIIMLTFFGVSISLHNGIRDEVRAIQQEMKDFHGRLEKQDAEFKGKLALQDLEFKTHLIHCHGGKINND